MLAKTEKYILSVLGITDDIVREIDRTCENFGVDFYDWDIINNLENGCYTQLGNAIIETLYRKVYDSVYQQVRDDLDIDDRYEDEIYSRFSCYVNGGEDSHIYFNDEEYYSFDEMCDGVKYFIRLAPLFQKNREKH